MRLLKMYNGSKLQSDGFIYDEKESLEVAFPPWYKPNNNELHELQNETLNLDTLNNIIDLGFEKIQQSFNGYEKRKDQISMAKDILHSLYHDEKIIVEAGTGTGKSFAYLIASLAFSYLKAVRVVISTETKNLQLQLYEKDLKFIHDNIDSHFSYSLALGSSNYLCRLRFNESISKGKFLDVLSEDRFQDIQNWSKNVFQGNDDGCYYFTPYLIPYSFWSTVSRDSQGCPGRRCEFFSGCNYYRVKNKWAASRIIVSNHHLILYHFLNDKTTLPPYSALIVDEAHGFLETSYNIFTIKLNTDSFEEHSKNFEKSFLGKAIAGEMAEEYRELFSETDRIWKKVFQNWEVTLDLSFEDDKSKMIENNHFQENSMLSEDYSIIIENLKEMKERLKDQEENLDNSSLINSINILIKFCEISISLFTAFIKRTDNIRQNIFWGEKRKGTFYLNTVPLNMGEIIKEYFTESSTFTSATLGYWPYPMRSKSSRELINKGYFNSIIRDYGGGNFFDQKKIYLSDFPYKKNAALYIPTHLSTPAWKAPDHIKKSYEENLFKEIKELSELSRGGALILFTSNYLLRKAYEYMIEESELEVFSQLEDGVSNAIQLFRNDPNSVLMGTISYWQGLDISGFSLRHIIITKLYFTPPDDPIFSARSEEMNSRGENSFFELSLPWSSTLLRQASGRLIRRKNDKGIISILDDRVITKNYGKILLTNLPEMKLFRDKLKLKNYSIEEELFHENSDSLHR